MAKKKTATAKQPKKETAVEGAKRKKPAVKKGTRMVEITGGVAWLGLPHNIGQTIPLDEKQAEEVVKANRGKYVD